MKYRAALIYLLELLACYGATFWYLGFWQTEPLWADGSSYVECCRMFFQENFRPHPTRPFGCALLFGWPYAWSAEAPYFNEYVFVVQFLFWIGSVIFLWRILFDINPKHAHLPAFIYGLTIGSMVISRQINSETPFIFFTTMALFAFNRFYRSGRDKWLIIAFSILCFATLIRPSGQYFVLGLFVLGLIRGMRRSYRSGKINALVVPGLFILVFSLTIGVRAFQMHHTFRVANLTVIQDFDLYVYLAGYSELWGLSDRHQRREAWRELADMRWAELKTITESGGYEASTQYARNRFFDRFHNAPFDVLKTYSRNILSNSVAPSFYIVRLGEKPQRPAYEAVVAFLQLVSRLQNTFYSALILIVVPLCLLMSANLRPDFWIMGWLFGLYIILTSAIAFAAGDRLQLTVVPFAMVSAYALANDPERKKNRHFSVN